MEENLKKFINRRENYNPVVWANIILTTSIPLHTKNTMLFPQLQTINTSLQFTIFQPLDLLDEGSIYRCVQRCELSMGFD